MLIPLKSPFIYDGKEKTIMLTEMTIDDCEQVAMFVANGYTDMAIQYMMERVSGAENLAEKLFGLVSLYAFSVRGYITTVMEYGMTNDYLLIESLSEYRISDPVWCQLKHFDVLVGSPREMFEGYADPLSSIYAYRVNGEVFEWNEKTKELNNIMDFGDVASITKIMNETQINTLKLAEGHINLPTTTEESFKFVAEKMMITLDAIYDMMYALNRHLGTSFDVARKMSPLKADILLRKHISTLEDEQKKREQDNNDGRLVL